MTPRKLISKTTWIIAWLIAKLWLITRLHRVWMINPHWYHYSHSTGELYWMQWRNDVPRHWFWHTGGKR